MDNIYVLSGDEFLKVLVASNIIFSIYVHLAHPIGKMLRINITES